MASKGLKCAHWGQQASDGRQRFCSDNCVWKPISGNRSGCRTVIDIITGALTADTNDKWDVGESSSCVSMLCFSDTLSVRQRSYGLESMAMPWLEWHLEPAPRVANVGGVDGERFGRDSGCGRRSRESRDSRHRVVRRRHSEDSLNTGPLAESSHEK